MAKKMISMRIEKEILDKIRELAKKDFNRTVTGYVERVLINHVKNKIFTDGSIDKRQREGKRVDYTGSIFPNTMEAIDKLNDSQ